jgi:excisionase family DNA binding protein
MTTVLESLTTSPDSPTAQAQEKLLVSRREAAARLSISQRAVDYLIANKTLSTKRIGSRVLIPTRDLQRFARVDHPERLAR